MVIGSKLEHRDVILGKRRSHEGLAHIAKGKNSEVPEGDATIWCHSACGGIKGLMITNTLSDGDDETPW